MNKEYVLGPLRTAFNNYIVGCLGGYLIKNSDSKKIPSKIDLMNLKFPEAKVSFNLEPMKAILMSKEKKEKILTEHMKSILRSFIKDTFETAKFYAKETNQLPKLKKANWYDFTRIIRNCLEHDFRLGFRDNDLKILPVKWCDKEISIDMDNKPLPVQVMNEAYAKLLYDDIFQYVETKLK